MDLIDFSGPAFKNVDNRVMALRLVQKELCDAALFDPSGTTFSHPTPSSACCCCPLLTVKRQVHKVDLGQSNGKIRPVGLISS